MADKRAEGKKLIGAQASGELWAGVDQWLLKNPNKTVTDFILSASLEKLEREGIKVDKDDVLRDRRARYPSHIPSTGENEQPTPGTTKGDKGVAKATIAIFERHRARRHSK